MIKSTKKVFPMVSIGIPMYKSKPYYKACLDSVLKTDYPNFEIIVVIDNDNETAKLLKSEYSNKKNLRIIFLHKRIWLSGTRTRCFKEAKGKYVALLDHDVEVDKNWITEYVNAIEANSDVAAIQGKTLDFHRRNIIQTTGLFLIRQIGWIYTLGLGEEDNGQYDAVKNSLAGATNIFYRKEIVKKLGYFDPKLKFNIDDLDLAIRMWISGYRTITNSKAIIYHWTAKTSKKRMMMIGRLSWEYEFAKLPRIIWKNYEFFNVIKYTPIVLLALLGRGVFNLFKGNIIPLMGFMAALIWNLLILPDTIKERNRIQKKLRVTKDREWMNKVCLPGNIINIITNYLSPQRKIAKTEFSQVN